MRLIIFAILSLCLSNSEAQPLSSPELDRVFSEEERIDLHKVVDFFQSHLCGDKDFASCMDSLIPILNDTGWTLVFLRLPFDEQENLYRELLSGVFDEIWLFGKTKRITDGQSYLYLTSHYSGKYREFLRVLGDRNGVLQGYSNDVEWAGDFGFSSFMRVQNDVQLKQGRIDLSDDGIKLIFAVNFLTMNDQMKRDELWIE